MQPGWLRPFPLPLSLSRDRLPSVTHPRSPSVAYPPSLTLHCLNLAGGRGGRGAAAARAEARNAAVGAAGARQAARARQQGVLQPLPLPQKKHADVTHPAQQQFQQGPAVSPSSRQAQRHMWSRPDVALQYGGLSLVECMQLFLPPGLRDTPEASDGSPDHSPEFNPAPVAAEADLSDREQFVPSMGSMRSALTAGAATAAAAKAAARAASSSSAPAAQQSTAAVAAHQLAHILYPDSHATEPRTMDSNPAHCSGRGLKRLRNDDTGIIGSAAHTNTRLPDTEAVDVSAVRSLLLGAATSQGRKKQCDSRPAIPTSWLLALLLQQNKQQQLHQHQLQEQQQQQQQHQEQQQQQPSLFTQGPISSKSAQSFPSSHGASIPPAAHCSSISAPTSGSLPALVWPLSFPSSFTPSFTPSLPSSFLPSIAPSLPPSYSPSLAPSLSSTHVSTTHPYLPSPLSSASPWRSTSRTPFTFGHPPSFPALHSALPHSLSPSLGSTVPPHTSPPTATPTTPPTAPPIATPTTSPIAPHSPLTSPLSAIPSPSSHGHSAAPFTPTSLITASTALVPSAPSTVINRGPPHSLPSFPSLYALQTALHAPPSRALPTLSDPSQQYPSQHHLSQRSLSQHHLSQRYPSRSASPSNAVSSASVDCSPPSSQTSSQQPTSQHVFQSSSQPSSQNLFQHTAAPVESQQLQVTRPHKMPRTSRGVLPSAALEFARSLFSGLPGADDHRGGKSSDRQQTSELVCTSAKQDSCRGGGNAETQCGCVRGDASKELPPMRCQPSLPDMVTAAAAAPGVAGTPDVTDFPAAAALAAAAEGICQGEASIWKDLIELEGEADGVVCGVEKRAGITVGSFCELEDLLDENVNLM
ncbi:unnamed protein product [Closterium sp. Naga37s-1]|nr:unnamed protein product [Closterium sp. Naga37s-1]